MYLSDISILTSEVDFSTLVMSFLYDLHECSFVGTCSCQENIYFQ